MKGRLLHENRPLSIHEVDPDRWNVWIRTTPPALLFSLVACPASAIAAAKDEGRRKQVSCE